MLEKLKKGTEKIDKKAMGMALGLMLMSWAALPIIYYLLVRKKKSMEEVKRDVEENGGVIPGGIKEKENGKEKEKK